MDSRSQIGLFIILSIFVVIGMIVIFSFSSDDKASMTNAKAQDHSKEAKLYLDSCVDIAMRKTVENLALHGGRYVHEEPVPTGMREITNISTYSYTPYLLQDKFFGPSEKEVAEQAADGVEMNLVSCLDMSPYPLSTDEEPKVNVSLESPMITAQISWPVRYEEGDVEVTYRSFAHSESYPAFFRFYDFAMEYSRNQTGYAPGDICLSCLERNMDQYDFSLYTEEVFFKDATMIVYVLFDENSTSGDIPLFGFSHLFLDREVVS